MKSDTERRRDKISCIISCVGVVILITLFAILLHRGPQQSDMDSMKCPTCGYDIKYRSDDIPSGADFGLCCKKCGTLIEMGSNSD